MPSNTHTRAPALKINHHVVDTRGCASTPPNINADRLVENAFRSLHVAARRHAISHHRSAGAAPAPVAACNGGHGADSICLGGGIHRKGGEHNLARSHAAPTSVLLLHLRGGKHASHHVGVDVGVGVNVRLAVGVECEKNVRNGNGLGAVGSLARAKVVPRHHDALVTATAAGRLHIGGVTNVESALHELAEGVLSVNADGLVGNHVPLQGARIGVAIACAGCPL